MMLFFKRGLLLMCFLALAGCKLSVNTEGGRGMISSKSGLISCGVDENRCLVDYSDYSNGGTSYTEVLTAQGKPGYRFSHWKGDCSGSSSCNVKLSKTSGDKSVTAVFVDDPLSTEKTLSEFKLLLSDNPSLPSDITGVINASSNHVKLTVPTTINVQSLVAHFSVTGVKVLVAGVEQNSSETINDFTDPVIYRVLAEDGSGRNYTVTIDQVDYQAKNLTSFILSSDENAGVEQDVVGQIDQTINQISLTVGKDVDLSSLIATFETTGELVSVNGVKQFSGLTANDFSGGAVYRVSALDQSFKEYQVDVSQSDCLEQTWVGNYQVLSSQDVSELEGYTRVSGKLSIGNSAGASVGLTDLEGLECLSSVGSLDVLGNPDLMSLNGLSGLTAISGQLLVQGNPLLESFNGLENLSQLSILMVSGNSVLSNFSGLTGLTVLNGLNVSNSPSMINFQGLSQLNRVGALYLEENPKLESFNGLSSLSVISNGLVIEGNPLLSSMAGLEGLIQLSGNITVRDNAELLNFSGLDQLASTLGSLTVENNDAMTSFEGLASVTKAGKLVIKNNSNLESLLGLNGLTQLSSLQLENNQSLENLEGLSGLLKITGRLALLNNDGMTSLSGAEALTSVSGSFDLERNNALFSVDGLTSLKSVGEASIRLNTQLADLDGLSDLKEIKGRFELFGNNDLLNLSGLASLEQVGSNSSDDFVVKGGFLTALNLPKLSTVTGDVLIDNSFLQDLGLPQLCRVGANFKVSHNTQLCSDKVESLRDQVISCDGIGGSVDVTGNLACDL